MTRFQAALACTALFLGLSGCSTDAKPLAVELGQGFHSDGSFDSRMTCDGAGDYSPPLVFRHVPQGTTELVLSMVDLDERSAHGDPVILWVEWAIPADSAGLEEHEKPAPAREAFSDRNEATYNGPCPAPGELHHYRFTLLALSEHLDLPYGAPARTVLNSAKPYIKNTAEVIAIYQRPHH